MNIYIVDDDQHFTTAHTKSLEKLGKLFTYDSFDKAKNDIYKDNGEKILAISPTTVAWKLPNTVVGKIRNLYAICLPTTGFDWVDGEYCKGKNIILTNVPHYSTQSVAEYIFFFMLCLARKLPLQIKSNFKIDYSKIMILSELKGKKVGIIGLGDIGNAIGKICASMQMEVYYWSRNKKETNFKYLPLDKLISTVDFVLPTLALNKETTDLLDKHLINKIKSTAFLVSTCHEKDEQTVFDKKYAISKAEKGDIAGLAFESDENLTNFKGNIMTTAHYAWYTQESICNDYDIWVETMNSLVKKSPINIVN